MHKITEVIALPNYTLGLTFYDLVYHEVCLADRLFGVFEPLKDPDYFARVKVDEFGAVCWPNGVDLCPDALYKAKRKPYD